jgi:flagella basal body P-ring formation protein FlgA
MDCRPIPLVAAVLLASPIASADTITLRSSVRIAPDRTEIVLADVARLDGAEALRHADLVVGRLGAAGAPLEISIDQVRMALTADDANLGLIDLSGRRVVVRPRIAAAAAPVAMEGASLAPSTPEPEDPAPESVPGDVLAAEPTLRGAIAREVIRGLDVRAEDLRLTLPADTGDVLAVTITGGLELTPSDGFRGDRMTFAAREWKGGVARDLGRFTVAPLQRRQVAEIVRTVSAGAAIGADDFIVSERWLAPGAAALAAEPSALVGRVAASRLHEGDLVRERHLRRTVLVARGDRVVVRCLVGGIAISLQAEARADGAAGDLIELRKPGERATFTARVVGAGEAVVDLTR